MDLKAEILHEHSRAQAVKILAYVGEDPERFGALMAQFFSGEYRITQRAAYPLSILAEKQGHLFIPYIGKMLEFMRGDHHDAVLRCSFKLFSLVDIPDEFLGEVVDLAFKYLEKGDAPIAIKVYSMSTIYRICKREPDLANELKLLIEAQMPMGSAGFVSRGRKILKGLEKML